MCVVAEKAPPMFSLGSLFVAKKGLTDLSLNSIVVAEKREGYHASELQYLQLQRPNV